MMPFAKLQLNQALSSSLEAVQEGGVQVKRTEVHELYQWFALPQLSTRKLEVKIALRAYGQHKSNVTVRRNTKDDLTIAGVKCQSQMFHTAG